MRKVAFLIDGTFFIKRYLSLRKGYHALNIDTGLGEVLKSIKHSSGVDAEVSIIKDLTDHCLKHLYDNDWKKHIINERLYRIFFYDCPPLSNKVHHPKTGESIDLSKSTTYTFRTALYKQIKQSRNFALRLGVLDKKAARWVIADVKKQNQVLRGERAVSELSKNDFKYYANQKEVDLKIGLDIATIAYKKLADKIVLLSGDSDFVPVAKLARREGMEFILDPMGMKPKANLQEHVDAVNSPRFNFDKKIIEKP